MTARRPNLHISRLRPHSNDRLIARPLPYPAVPRANSGTAAGMAMPSGPMVGMLPQGPGQDPWVGEGDPAAQLAAMLR